MAAADGQEGSQVSRIASGKKLVHHQFNYQLDPFGATLVPIIVHARAATTN